MSRLAIPTHASVLVRAVCLSAAIGKAHRCWRRRRALHLSWRRSQRIAKCVVTMAAIERCSLAMVGYMRWQTADLSIARLVLGVALRTHASGVHRPATEFICVLLCYRTCAPREIK